MLDLSLDDSHTGIDYWLNIPVKDLREWLELLNEHYEAKREAYEKASKR